MSELTVSRCAFQYLSPFVLFCSLLYIFCAQYAFCLPLPLLNSLCLEIHQSSYSAYTSYPKVVWPCPRTMITLYSLNWWVKIDKDQKITNWNCVVTHSFLILLVDELQDFSRVRFVFFFDVVYHRCLSSQKLI